MNLTTVSAASRWALRMLEAPSDLVMPVEEDAAVALGGLQGEQEAVEVVGAPSVTRW